MKAFDVIVIGRGAVGAAAALSLSAQGRRVALVGPAAGDPATADADDPAAGNPGGWDARIFALSPASRTLLEAVGAWQHCDPARIAPVYDMRLFNQAGGTGSFGLPEVHLDAYDAKVEALAWIVENRLLQQGLDRALRESAVARVDGEMTALTLPDPARGGRQNVRVTLDGDRLLQARLVVGADGSGSRTRDLAGIAHRIVDHDQTAVVANFESALPSRDCAWQWFGDHGVLALLPLPAPDPASPADGTRRPEGGTEAGAALGRLSLVWSVPTARVAEVAADGLADRVRDVVGGRRFGPLRLITPPSCYPLRSVRCDTVIAPGLALVGDAAHAVHPMAGQGMNLGFGDVAALAAALAGDRPETVAAAPFVADRTALRRYERARREPVALMQWTLDGLGQAFGLSSGGPPGPLAGIRDLGWRFVASSRWLRRRMVLHAVS